MTKFRVGDRVWVRVVKRYDAPKKGAKGANPTVMSLSAPVLAEVVHLTRCDERATVRLLDDPGTVGWAAGDTYRCSVADLTAGPTRELLTGTKGEACPAS